MALKPDRNEAYTDVSFFMNTTAERGGIVTHQTGGTGSAMDDASAVVAAPAAVGEDPAGLLLNDVVDLDLTRQHINWFKDEVQKGSKVTLLRRGFVVTDALDAGAAPSAGDQAYFTAGGDLTEVNTGSAVVGRFLSGKDTDGYAKVDINI